MQHFDYCMAFLTLVRHSCNTLNSMCLVPHPALFACFIAQSECFIAHRTVSQQGISQCYPLKLVHPGSRKCSLHIFNFPSKKCLDMHAETMGHNGNEYSWAHLWPSGHVAWAPGSFLLPPQNCSQLDMTLCTDWLYIENILRKCFWKWEPIYWKANRCGICIQFNLDSCC